ncbi:tyrosine-type recombinase/integrase [Spirosoma jeollabukense]
MIRIHLRGHKPARVLTSVKIDKAVKYWNPKKTWGKWVFKHPNKESLNIEIEHEYLRIKEQVQTWQRDQPNTLQIPLLLAERFRIGISDLYFDWTDKVLDDAKEQAFQTYKNKRIACTLFEKFAGSQTPLESVSSTLVRQFQDHLRKETLPLTGKRRKGSTINGILTRLHKVHQDVLIKRGISPKRAKTLSPWLDAETLATLKPKKAKLNESSIAKVSTVRIKTQKRTITPEGTLEVWMLAYSLAGARFGDVMKLRYREFETDEFGTPVSLRYEMMKTGNVMNVPVFADAWQILKKYWKLGAKPTDYVLPYLKNTAPYAKLVTYEQYRTAPFELKQRYSVKITSLNTKMNVCLKEIERAAGLTEPLRFHNSRHSFADLARRTMEKDGSITMYDIQKMMGHSDFKTTEIYTKDLQERDTTQAMNAIFNRKIGKAADCEMASK